jgi:Domain of Unknown Function with PDB structure (DUF3857)
MFAMWLIFFTVPKNPMKNATKILFFCLSILSAKAQISKPAPIEFGKVEIADLQQKIYAKDSSAEAVVLCDYSTTYFLEENGISKVTERIIRIKILKKSGYERGTIALLYSSVKGENSKTESVKDLKATTYNLEDGQIMTYSVGKKDIFDEKYDADTREIHFAFPQVKEGSILEYSYRTESPFWYTLPTWYFQRGIPVQWTETRYTIPQYLNFKMIFQSYLPLKINENASYKTHFWNSSQEEYSTDYHFAIADVPALKDESFVTTVRDYTANISFELASFTNPNTFQETKYSITYDELAKTLLEANYFGKQIGKFDEARVLAKTLSTQSNSENLGYKIAYDYLRNYMTWNSENSIYIEENLGETYTKQTGNSTEINLMLVRLLREMGYDANPVILSTRSHGKINEEIALMNKFNYTVAHILIEGKDVFLDATSALLPAGVLPERCLNGTGFLVNKKMARIVQIPNTERYNQTTMLDVELDTEGSLKGNVKVSGMGYAGLNLREKLVKDGKEKFIEDFKKKRNTWKDTKIELMNFDATNSPLVSCETTITEAVTIAGERMYLNPMQSSGESKNIFPKNNRYYPVDMTYLQTDTFVAKYKIPKGYVIEELPKSAKVTMPEGKGSFTYIVAKNEDGTLGISSRIVFNKSIFPAEDYEILRQFFDQIVQKHAEQVVLKKL